jgi:signal peptidase I
MSTKNIIKAFVIATVTALTVRLFIIEDYRIASDSMQPGLLKGDLILVSKAAFNLRLPFSNFELARTGAPKRSEVVAFTVPDQGADTFIKRVVALAGDKIEIKDGVLWLNGNAQEENDSIIGKEAMANYGPVDVPAEHFFVLGDNRSESIDSRQWGPIPYSCLKGRVALVWLSVGSEGVLRPQRWLSAVK